MPSTTHLGGTTMPVIEVVCFPASETYIANPAVFNEALDAIAMAKGQIE